MYLSRVLAVECVHCLMFDCLLEYEYFNTAFGNMSHFVLCSKKTEGRTDTYAGLLIRAYATLASRNLKLKPSVPTAPFPFLSLTLLLRKQHTVSPPFYLTDSTGFPYKPSIQHHSTLMIGSVMRLILICFRELLFLKQSSWIIFSITIFSINMSVDNEIACPGSLLLLLCPTN